MSQWVEGARLRTLPLSVAPVIAGSALAFFEGGFAPLRALLALVVSVALQLGVNFANDYSDGIRGTDTDRVGPQRLVASGAAAPRTVKGVAFGFFGLAGLAGLALVVLTQQWWLLAVGAACVLAAWFYTGGKHPYGYAGLGEVFVFIFFGLVAVAGTVYVQLGRVSAATWVAAAAAGFGACAVLVANNLRDIDTDLVSGKRTLATRLGDQGTRLLFVLLCLISTLGFGALAWFTAPPVLLGVVMVIPLGIATRIVATGDRGMGLVRVLKLVGIGQLLGAIGCFVGAVLSSVA